MRIFEYRLKKNTKLGITAMSLVDMPAIMVDFVKLEEETPKLKLKVDEDEMIVSGPALIPDLKIFRNAESLGAEEDGYIYFSKETVKEMSELFMTNERMNTITLDHDLENSDLKLVESWIVLNNENDKSKEMGFDLPSGTWMTSYKVENIKLWEKIKAGEYNGFSIEAMDFEKRLVEMNKNIESELTEEEIYNEIGAYIDMLVKKHV